MLWHIQQLASTYLSSHQNLLRPKVDWKGDWLAIVTSEATHEGRLKATDHNSNYIYNDERTFDSHNLVKWYCKEFDVNGL